MFHIGLKFKQISKVQVKLGIPHLEILSKYEWPGWSSSEGDMNTTFLELQVGLKFHLGISSEGFLEIVDLEVFMEFNKMKETV